jgi:ABC-type antimicrobial peptide transport system permease subunit
MQTDDTNIERRHAFFYAAIAPHVELYRVPIGSTLSIKAVSRSGYVRTANLKVYGTYAFSGLESSPQAGALNMVDLMSFRELYGFVSSEDERELEALRANKGAHEISRDDVESALFGRAAPGPAAAHSTSASPHAAAPNLTEIGRAAQRPLHARYSPDELEHGVFLNAAVLLTDPSKLTQTMTAIQRAATDSGQPLTVIPWQKAAGMVGQFATLMRGLLFGSVFVILIVALVVINNALVMAALERVRELGTLRAIGAQRVHVMSLLAMEYSLLGVLAGLLGGALGAALLWVLSHVGIPGNSDITDFIFAGPRLFPAVHAGQIVMALGVVTLVSLGSGAYPALIALRVSAREAMHTED